MVVSFGIDKNDNGSFDDYTEPTILKKYNYKTDKLSDIVKKQLYIELQKTLEGSK